MDGVSKIVRRVQLIAAVGLLLSGCSSALDANDARPETEQAREHLIDHEVDEAQALYSAALVENPDHGHAAAGKAVTDLLLLAESVESQPFWVEFLRADSLVDAGSVLYERGGLFYWMSRGVPWADEGDYAGIRSLISDRLPWSAPRLESLYAFTRGLDRTFGDNVESTVAMADALAQIERELRVALEDDDFEAFILPGEVFHATDVDVVMGPAELAVLSSAVSFLRGVIYLNAAYAHDWTPEGAVIEADGDPQAQIDHAAGYLDVRLYRLIEYPERLGDARESFARALRSLRESVNVGGRSSANTALNWRLLSSAERDQLVALLTGAEEALYGPAPIPYTQPATSMDLSSFFEQGRVLPLQDDEQLPVYWMAPMSPEDEPAAALVPGWKLDDDALQAAFVDGVFEPGFRIGGANAPELQVSGNVKDDLVPTVASELNREVQRTY